MDFETKCLHAGFDPYEFKDNPALVPIYQNTSFLFDSPEHAANLFALKEEGQIYTRIGNTTVAVLEERISQLEEGSAAVAVSSGQAAITLALLGLAGQGDEVIASPYLYGGTYTLFRYTLPRFGIKVRFVDINDLSALEDAINDKTRAIYGEVIGNPSLIPMDIEAVARLAHSYGVALVVDNTFATPFLVQPIKWGADVVVHSMTKYLSGHGTSIGGIIVESGAFDWKASRRYKSLVEPDPAYHNLNFWETFGNTAYTSRIRLSLLRDIGPALSPMNAYLILLGIETLHLRMERHSKNAKIVAEFLENRDDISRVFYPGLKSNPYFELAEKYFYRGLFSGMVCFSLKQGRSAGETFIKNLPLFYHLANVGDARSLVIHPASTTHQQLTSEELEACGIDEGFIRLSIGIESIEDIITAIEKALVSI